MEQESPNILVVDDDQGMLKTLCFILKARQYTIVGADSGENALDILTSQPFDIVISDIKMTGMNGVELLKRINALRPQTKVIMITAYTMHSLVEEAKNQGAVAVYSKPIDIDGILELINTLVHADPEKEDTAVDILMKRLQDVENQLQQKEQNIAALTSQLAALKNNPALVLKNEKRGLQSDAIERILNNKQAVLFNALSAGEKSYAELLQTAREQKIDIRDMVALRLQISRLTKKIEENTHFRIQRIRRKKVLYLQVIST
ncbi:response regulator [Thermodesulfobacteriota bacterium]